jgi:soluble lytic murein transglycosylase-like protein
VWSVVRFVVRAFWRLAWWQKLAVAIVGPLCALNLTVAILGHSAVFPLSPNFVPEKLQALKRYALHRPHCLLSGHGDLEAITAEAEREARLPRGLMQAVVEVESEGSPHRISYAGAMGPVQLMPGTAAMLGVKDPYDPAEAIPAGARYLASMLHRFHDVKLAVAAYNAGPGAVNGAVPQNGQTEVYVARVMARYRAPVARR